MYFQIMLRVLEDVYQFPYGISAPSDTDHFGPLLPISAITGELSTLSRRSSIPPPMVMNRFIEYSTVNLIHLVLVIFLLPPACRRFTLQHLMVGLIMVSQVQHYWLDVVLAT